jgi:predicted NBD/HSP70 family sugar kinase
VRAPCLRTADRPGRQVASGGPSASTSAPLSGSSFRRRNPDPGQRSHQCQPRRDPALPGTLAVDAYGRESLDALGCSFAGAVDRDGVVSGWPNRASWKGHALLDDLRAFAPHVSIADDGVCAARAEMAVGVAQDVRDFLSVSFGTGVGGCFVLDRSVRRARSDDARSIGHLRLLGEQHRCVCGWRGCVQTVLCGHALAQADAARHISAPLWDAVERLARWCADVCHQLGLEMVVLSGGSLARGEWIRAALLDVFQREGEAAGVAAIAGSHLVAGPALGALLMLEERTT